MRYLTLLSVLLVADTPAITLPLRMQQESAQTQQTVDTVKADEWYVIESPEPLLVLDSPAGIVSIEHDTGPLRLRGRFAGGTGIEARTIEAQHVYLITPKIGGQVELLIVPSGSTSAGDIVRQKLTVSGVGPRPPTIDPQPEPVPVPSGLQVMLLIDQSASPQAFQAVGSVPVLQWLDSATSNLDGGKGWRKYDRTSLAVPETLANESPTWRKLWQDIGPSLPPGPLAVIIRGSTVTTKPITTQAQLLEDLQNAVK